MNKIKICIIVTDPINLFSLYRDQFNYLENNGFDVTAIASNGVEHDRLEAEGIKTKAIFMKKAPSIFFDLRALVQLIWFLLFNRFDIISISTPKASLLGGLAAFFTFHKNIIYTIRGRAYEHYRGYRLRFYHCIEKYLCSVSKKVFCISHEMKDDFIDLGLCDKDKIFVIGEGSSNGVDLKRFTRSAELEKEALSVQRSIDIDNSDIVILCSGRIRKDKGINELVHAFNKFDTSNVHLILQGRFEMNDPLDDDVMSIIDTHSKIHLFDWEEDIEKFYVMADIFAFPSHREGFGNVALEASAMEIPVIGFDVIGVRESIEKDVTGIIVKNIDSDEYYMALKKLVDDSTLRIRLGVNGRKRIEEKFDSLDLWKELVKVYNNMMKVS